MGRLGTICDSIAANLRLRIGFGFECLVGA